MNCVITETWGKTPFALRPTTEIQPHESLDLAVLGYRTGVRFPRGPLADEIVELIDSLADSGLPMNPEKCLVTEVWQKTDASKHDVLPAEGFRLLALGYLLGTAHQISTPLSPEVQEKLHLLALAEEAENVEPPTEHRVILTPEQEIKIAALRARQAPPPPPPVEPVSLIPAGALAPIKPEGDETGDSEIDDEEPLEGSGTAIIITAPPDADQS